MWKKLFTLVFVLFLFIGCGSGGGSDSIADANLPPDPGEAGKATLLGIDVNNNGVRDDVERYIAFRFQGYPNAQKEKAIAMQYARATQKILADPSKALETTKLIERVMSCHYYYIEQNTDGKSRDFYYKFADKHRIINDTLEDIIYNTRDRVNTYLTYEAKLSGHSLSSGSNTLDQCDENIDLIED